MSSLVSWAWFRPTENAMGPGRPVVPLRRDRGTEKSEELRDLPETAKALAGRRPTTSG